MLRSLLQSSKEKRKGQVIWHEGASVPLAFLFKLTDKLTPSNIGDRFGEAVIFDQILDSQTLDADHLVFVDNGSRELVLVVSSSVVDTSMDAGNFETGLVPVLGTVTKIDRFYPSSKTCSSCKHVLDSLTLDVREWVCPECGVVHDRDTNAAKNILTEGLSVAACRGSVRPVRAKARRATPVEAGTSRS